MRSVARVLTTGLIVLMLGAPTVFADALVDAQRLIQHERHRDALKLLKPLAEAGNPRAQVLLGELYSRADGRFGVRRDYDRAQDWFERACKQNHLRGCAHFGASVIHEDAKRGRQVLEAAAKRGDPYAQTMLGIHLMGHLSRLSPDRKASRYWLRKAAEQQHAIGADWLGNWYRGEPGGAAEAYKWKYIAEYLWGSRKRPKSYSEFLKRSSKAQLADAERRAKAWLKAKGVKP